VTAFFPGREDEDSEGGVLCQLAGVYSPADSFVHFFGFIFWIGH
jgi:hypothetical protein